jgi:hypothetical protein
MHDLMETSWKAGNLMEGSPHATLETPCKDTRGETESKITGEDGWSSSSWWRTDAPGTLMEGGEPHGTNRKVERRRLPPAFEGTETVDEREATAGG